MSEVVAGALARASVVDLPLLWFSLLSELAREATACREVRVGSGGDRGGWGDACSRMGLGGAGHSEPRGGVGVGVFVGHPCVQWVHCSARAPRPSTWHACGVKSLHVNLVALFWRLRAASDMARYF